MSKQQPSQSAVFSAPHELASVANDPSSSSSWQSWGLNLVGDQEAKPPSLPPGTLPDVGLKDFAGYLQSVGPRIEDFERDKVAAKTMADNMLLPEDMQAKQGQGLMQAMTEVPAMFFQTPFDLDNPDLWAGLIDVKAEHVEKRGLEKLSLYLDSVETHLVNEIAARYDSFFDASGQVQQLKTTITALCQQVSTMRKQTMQLEQEAAVDLRSLLSLSRQRKNLQDTVHMLQGMESVVQAESALQAVLQSSTMSADYAGAIDVTDLLRNSLKNKEIRRLKCFQGLPAYIDETTERIKQVMVADFLERTQAQIDQNFIPQLANGVLADASGSSSTEPTLTISTSNSSTLREELYPLLLGLQRVNELPAAFKAMQMAGCDQIRDLLNSLTTYTFDFAEKQPSPQLNGTSQNKRELSPFPIVLQAVHVAVRSYMDYAESLWKVINSSLTDVPEAAASNTGKLREAYMQAIAESTASHWSKLLLSHIPGSSGSTTARMEEMEQVLKLTDNLATVLEEHCSRSVLGLRTAVQQFCRAGLDSMHNESMRNLTAALEAEQWTRIDPGEGSRRFVAELLGRAQGTPQQPSLVESKLVVGDQSFHIVAALQLLLETLGKYMAFRDCVPGFSAEVTQRVIELMKVFNSRTCQLVLGAGAMQIAGLKSITAKHLALSCQSVGALVALLPSLQTVFLQDVSQSRKSMLAADFSRAKADLNIHCEEICHKLVSIMHDRLHANITQLPSIAATWSNPSQSGVAVVNAPSNFAAANIKQLKILSNVLLPLLLPAELENIFGQISELYSSVLAEGYGQLEPLGRTWEMQVGTDIRYILENLKELPLPPELLEKTLFRLEKLYTLYKDSIVLQPPAPLQPSIAEPVEEGDDIPASPQAPPPAQEEAADIISEEPAAVLTEEKVESDKEKTPAGLPHPLAAEVTSELNSQVETADGNTVKDLGAL